MEASVIVSTYNQPEYLWRCLLGFSTQEAGDFEIVVADDGSDERTASVVDRARRELGLQLGHVWQPDEGFRKCRILNRAVEAARADYLLFTDGDCIPRRDFVATHLARRRRGCYLSGGYIKVPAQVSAAIDSDAILSGDFAKRDWLVRHGMPRTHRWARLSTGPVSAGLLNRLSRHRARWHGHNASAWADDVWRVNGFDERMGWGAEDLEFGDRLVNAGVRPVQIRYSTYCIHLHHERPWRDASTVTANRGLRVETRAKGRAYTEHGIRNGLKIADQSSLASSQPASRGMTR